MNFLCVSVSFSMSQIRVRFCFFACLTKLLINDPSLSLPVELRWKRTLFSPERSIEIGVDEGQANGRST